MNGTASSELILCPPRKLVFIGFVAAAANSLVAAILLVAPIFGALELTPSRSFMPLSPLLFFGYSIGFSALPDVDELEFLIEQFRCEPGPLAISIVAVTRVVLLFHKRFGARAKFAYASFIGVFPALSLWAFT